MREARWRQADVASDLGQVDLFGQVAREELAGLLDALIDRGDAVFGGFFEATDQQTLKQIDRQFLGRTTPGFVSLFDLLKKVVEFSDQRLVRQRQATDLVDLVAPLEPGRPVSARAEIKSAVIPIRTIWRAAIKMRRFGRKQQQIAGVAIERIVAVKDLATALDGHVDDETAHPVFAVDEEIERAILDDRGRPGHQIDVERITRQQGIELLACLVVKHFLSQNDLALPRLRLTLKTSVEPRRTRRETIT